MIEYLPEALGLVIFVLIVNAVPIARAFNGWKNRRAWDRIDRGD